MTRKIQKWQLLLLTIQLLHVFTSVATSSVPTEDFGGNIVEFDGKISERKGWTEMARDEEFGFLIVLYLIDEYREKFQVQIMETGSDEIMAKSSLVLSKSDLANIQIRLQSKLGHFSVYNSNNDVLSHGQLNLNLDEKFLGRRNLTACSSEGLSSDCVISPDIHCDGSTCVPC